LSRHSGARAAAREPGIQTQYPTSRFRVRRDRAALRADPSTAPRNDGGKVDRHGTGREVGYIALFLISNESFYVNARTRVSES
jgi:hypothetical protein